MIQVEEKQWEEIKRELNDLRDKIQRLRAWNQTAAESNKAIDAYLRKLNPDLPEHYGMPIDGIRETIRNIINRFHGYSPDDTVEIDAFLKEIYEQ